MVKEVTIITIEVLLLLILWAKCLETSQRKDRTRLCNKEVENQMGIRVGRS